MTVNAVVGGRVRQRALLVFMVLAGLLAMHGLTAGHDPLMPSSHPASSAATAHGVASPASGHASAARHVRAQLPELSAATADSASAYLDSARSTDMSMGAACTAILTGALALVLLALALAYSRSRWRCTPRQRDQALERPRNLGPPRRTSLTLVQLSLSRT